MKIYAGFSVVSTTRGNPLIIWCAAKKKANPSRNQSDLSSGCYYWPNSIYL